MVEDYTETSISCIEEFEHVPHYATYHTSIVATGKTGRAHGELDLPSGVAINGDTHQIFVAIYSNDRIEIFSETGEYLYQLGVGQLSRPFGIAIHGDGVFISCWGDHTVSKFSMTEMCLIRRIGGRGLNNGQFNHPSQITTDPNGDLFIADCDNNRICIFDHISSISVYSYTKWS